MSALVIGVGQLDRGDDAIGLMVAEEVRRTAPHCEVVTVTSPTRLIDAWEGRDHAVVVDAIRSGRRPGQVSVIEVGAQRLPARPGAGGSHGFGVAEAIELGRTLNRLPDRLVVVGIDASTFAPGAAVTPAVGAALAPAAAAVMRAVSADGESGGES